MLAHKGVHQYQLLERLPFCFPVVHCYVAVTVNSLVPLTFCHTYLQGLRGAQQSSVSLASHPRSPSFRCWLSSARLPPTKGASLARVVQALKRSLPA